MQVPLALMLARQELNSKSIPFIRELKMSRFYLKYLSLIPLL